MDTLQDLKTFIAIRRRREGLFRLPYFWNTMLLVSKLFSWLLNASHHMRKQNREMESSISAAGKIRWNHGVMKISWHSFKGSLPLLSDWVSRERFFLTQKLCDARLPSLWIMSGWTLTTMNQSPMEETLKTMDQLPMEILDMVRNYL